MEYRYQQQKNIITFFELLNRSGVNYVLIKNINNELPDRLKVGKDIDILVKENDQLKFRSFMKKIARQYIHPCGKEKGWKNMYGLPEFEFWRLNQKEDLWIDVTYMLCCKSLMPNIWIPLDNMIQKYLWAHKEYDRKNNWWILDINTRFVYYFVRCIFDKKDFNLSYINEIKSAKELIDREIVAKMFDMIFFNFSSELMRMIDNDTFVDIRNAFLSYSDY